MSSAWGATLPRGTHERSRRIPITPIRSPRISQEQVAAAVRLALAEILASDHDGCLPLIFDDAFAYSDPARIQSLQRMLDLAAHRGLQIIILTCTPADYSAFGATGIRLPP